MARFEYRVERFHPDDVQGGGSTVGSGLLRCPLLNDLGSEGWELVAVSAISIPYDLVFKREVAPDSEKEEEKE